MNIKNINFNQLNKISSVFGKLIVSYIIVVVMVTCILGVVSYLFFASQFNRELEKVHQKAMEQVSDTLKFRMMKPVIQSFMNLSTDYIENETSLFHFSDPINGNHYKLYHTYDYLKQTVAAHSEIICAIHVYYKKQDLIISSQGIKFLKNKHQSDSRNYDWIQFLDHLPDSSLWLEPRQPFFNLSQPKYPVTKSNIFTFVRTYPIISTGENYQGLIGIDVSEDFISNIIQSTIPSQYQNTFIINQQGRIISHPQKNLLDKMLNEESYMRQILSSSKTYDSFISKVNRQKSMITFTSLPDTDWKVINITPLGQFYQRTHYIQLLLIAISLSAILIGFIISFIFTRQIYNPLGVIIQKVRSLVGATGAGAAKENEYGFINRFIDDISAKVQSLQATEPFIKNNLIMGLLYHQFFSEQELTEKLNLLGDNFKFAHYNVVLLQLDEKAARNLTLEESQAIKNDLIREIQQYQSAGQKWARIDLPDRRIGVIIGAENPDSGCLHQLTAMISSYACSKHWISVTGAAGAWTGSLLEIHQSFKEATLLFKYQYFYPQVPLLEGAVFLKKERSAAMLPDSIIKEFSAGLRQRDLKQVEGALALLSNTIAEGDYSANHCRQKILEITYLFSVYLKEIQYLLSENERTSLENLLTENINEFKTWIGGFAKEVFHWVEMRTNNRNYQVVEQAIKYLAEHLDADLSLDAAAERVNLSPSYFSKIFKEITGVAFTAYLTDLRIEKARELLLQTALTIQEIGFKVGYNAPAYFIKQFKSKYGMTPYDYRRQFQTRTFTT